MGKLQTFTRSNNINETFRYLRLGLSGGVFAFLGLSTASYLTKASNESIQSEVHAARTKALTTFSEQYAPDLPRLSDVDIRYFASIDNDAANRLYRCVQKQWADEFKGIDLKDGRISTPAINIKISREKLSDCFAKTYSDPVEKQMLRSDIRRVFAAVTGGIGLLGAELVLLAGIGSVMFTRRAIFSSDPKHTLEHQ